MFVPEQSHQVLAGGRSATRPCESIRAGHDGTRLADDNVLVLGINNRAEIRIAGEGLGRPNASGVVARGDESVDADGDGFLCSASDGVKRANPLAIVPFRPIGRTGAEPWSAGDLIIPLLGGVVHTTTANRQQSGGCNYECNGFVHLLN